MCAIIGVIIDKPTYDDFTMVRRLFLESQIRGKHATGFSYVRNGSVITRKSAVSADKFDSLHYLDQCVNEDGNLYLVGHCRYSTSDLEFNQPIADDKLSVVHNGVISQELPEKWESLYGYQTKTRNDTELLLRTRQNGDEPLIVWKDASLAVCELNSDRTITTYRNGKRPLYLTTKERCSIITSTLDVVKRSGIKGEVTSIPMNLKMTFDERQACLFEKIEVDGEYDFQNTNVIC
jgi:glutamine phosphoribosylpyrophosphate amidotransferase